MQCSLCLTQKRECITLPCNHNICYCCVPQQFFSSDILHYQCQACLCNHEIQIGSVKKQKNHCDKLSSSNLQKNYPLENQSQTIFCWTCQEAIKLKQFSKGNLFVIKGRHQQHSVQTYDEALPSIKNLLIQQLNRSSNIKSSLLKNKQRVQNNKLKENYQALNQKINQFFYQQIRFVETKRQRVISEFQAFYQQSLSEVESRLAVLQPLLEKVDSLQDKISLFLNDHLPITSLIPISSILFKIENYANNLQAKSNTFPELPKFIPKHSLKTAIDQLCCFFVNQKNNQEKREVFSSEISLKKDVQYLMIKQVWAKKNSSFQNDQNMQRKVKLVQKLKDKMNCSSTYPIGFL